MATTMAVGELNDAELIASARKGDSDAFGELYRRHVDSAKAAARALTRSRSDADDLTSEAFARVLRAMQGGGGPEVSFRPYLVTAVRNVFYDKVRRTREEPSPNMGDEVNVALLEAANSQEDGAFAAAAFATLPERWQLVLWHTEVEGRPVAEVAPMLGLAPNAVAALAFRAREGLRQAYLQAHLREQRVAECRECAASLGAYVRDGLSARDRRRIDAHLDGCDSCTALVAELTDTNNTLRAALIPALIGVSSVAYLSGLGGHGLLGLLTRVPKKQATVGACAAASVVAIAAFAGFLGGGNDSPELGAPTSTSVAFASTTVDLPPVTSSAPNNTASTVPPVLTTSPATSEVPPPSVSQVSPAPPTTVRQSVTTAPQTTGPTRSDPVTTVPVTTVPVTTVPVTTVPVTTTTQLPAPASLSITTQQLSAALAGGLFDLRVTVANTGASAVSGLQLDLAVPAGASLVSSSAIGLHEAVATFVRATATGWSCTGNVSCTLAALPPGQSSVLQLTFVVSQSAPANLTLTPVISSPAGSLVTSSPVTMPVGSVSDLLFAESANGALRSIGNTVVTCEDLNPNCAAARDGTATGTAQDHNSYVMQYVNSAGGTFNSSSAHLGLTGVASKAYLVWSADLDQAGMAPSPADFNKVRFTTPAGSTVVTADNTKSFDSQVPGNLGMYAAYADVTSLVAGSGTYSVADVQTALGQGSFGGWSLIVVDHDASLPQRFLMVAAPFGVITGTSPSTSLSIGVDLPREMVNATGAIVAPAFEGDRNLQLDVITLSGFTINNPFRGQIGGQRDPSFDNSLGTDLVDRATSGMNGSRLVLDVRTGNDRVIVPLVGVSLDL